MANISLLCALGALLFWGAAHAQVSSHHRPSDHASLSHTQKAQKNGDDRVRTDMLPLAKRFPALAQAPSVRWVGGTMGGAAAPGPSSYWIDAVVLPDADLLRTIQALPEWTTAPLPNDLHAAIADSLPDQSFETAPGLNRLFTHGTWHSQAYFQRSSGLLVLTSVGQ